MRGLALATTALVAIALIPAVALAHAHLDHATPAAGSAVNEPPKEVMLWFTEAVEPKFSSIEVRDEKGAAVQAGAARPVPGNTAQLTVTLKPLTPGTYVVKWRVLSVDTHHSQGDFSFRVGP